jgi:arylsulfatase A-like enzyme
MTLNRRQFLQGMAAAMAWGGRTQRARAGERRPNIVFLLTDDQSYMSLGCMGNAQVKTPQMDRLGSEGVIFAAHYDTTSICMASRATIMTGMYEYKTGCNFTRGSLARALWNQSYPVLLRKAGYFTGFAGKFGFAVTDTPDQSNNWHRDDGMPADSFDVWRGWPGQGKYQTGKNKSMRAYADEYPHVTRAVGAASRDFIKAAARQERPFCLSVSFKAPHLPNSPDPKYDDVYEHTQWDQPPNYDEAGAAHLPVQAKSGRQYLTIAGYRPSSYQSNMRKYHQLIYGVDQAVGVIRQALDEHGVADNTVIILTSDNGYNCGAHRFGGKVLPYEEGSRAPLIIYDPRIEASDRPKRCQAVTGNIDMMPTIMDFAGLPIPARVDGKSLRPLLRNPKGRLREAMAILNVWGNVPTHEMAVVSERYKYIHWFYAGEGMQAAEELYDRQADPCEMTNLADNPEMQSVLEKMRLRYDRELQRWQEQCARHSGYPDYVTLFDRRLRWEEKASLISDKQIAAYQDMVANTRKRKKTKD